MKKNNLVVSFSILLAGIYLFICLMLAGFGGILFRQGNGTWGDLFSLGQFLADICLMPFAILAFYITLQEIRKSQEHADLIMGWETSNGIKEVVTNDWPMSANFYSPAILFANNGNSPSVNYQITLEIPTKFGKTKMTDSSWRGDRQGENEKFIFTSAPHVISFPNAPSINLGKIEFTESALLTERLDIKYYIASDKDEFKSGTITIKLLKVRNN